MQAFAGAFNWLATRTRPDLAYYTSLLASSCTHHGQWSADLAHKVLWYLRGSSAQWRMLPASGCEDDLRVFSDAGFAGASTKSQSGLAIIWGGSLITWRSSRAALSALSTAEAELCAAALAWEISEGARALLEELGIRLDPIKLLLDNDAALAIAGQGSS